MHTRYCVLIFMLLLLIAGCTSYGPVLQSADMRTEPIVETLEIGEVGKGSETSGAGGLLLGLFQLADFLGELEGC